MDERRKAGTGVAAPALPAEAPSEAALPIIKAYGLGLRTKLGCPFAGMDLELLPGQLMAVRGRSGSGKTSLLLTLAGRMAHTEGSLDIAGFTMPHGRAKAQRCVGLGFFDGVNGLPAGLLVREAAAAELDMHGKPHDAAAVEAFLSEWALADVSLMRLEDLSREKYVRLGIALALAGEPAAIAVDDVETGLADVQTHRLMALLAHVAHVRGVAVLVGCVERAVAEQADCIVDMT